MVSVDDGFRECLRRFLREVVTDASGDGTMLVSTAEFLRVCRLFRMWRTVRVTLKSDCGNRDAGCLSEPIFECIESPSPSAKASRQR